MFFRRRRRAGRQHRGRGTGRRRRFGFFCRDDLVCLLEEGEGEVEIGAQSFQRCEQVLAIL